MIGIGFVILSTVLLLVLARAVKAQEPSSVDVEVRDDAALRAIALLHRRVRDKL